VRTERRRPSFGITLFTVLLPVVLMLGKALVDISSTMTPNGSGGFSTSWVPRCWRC
jgi:H+/gluconate symporter-like permease